MRAELAALLLLTVPAQADTFTAMVQGDHSTTQDPVLLGTIYLAGDLNEMRVHSISIGGASSYWNMFWIVSSTPGNVGLGGVPGPDFIDITFGIQPDPNSAFPPPAYMLATPPTVTGPNSNSRGFSYDDVNLSFTMFAPLYIYWLGNYGSNQNDEYTYGLDRFGNFYDDSANPNSLRVLVNYTITPVPPALPLFAGGLVLLGVLSRRRRNR